MVELFEACQQQVSDLEKKEVCRAQLQQDIQRVYAGVYKIYNHCIYLLSVEIRIECGSHRGTTVLDWIFYERTGLQEQ